jgi:lipopolysaccharide/colanic/teichoic acid biosynthesis glycosyltransferase
LNLHNLFRSRNSLPPERVQYAFDSSWESEILPRQLFMKMLCVERKRSERSGRRFVLMLLDPGKSLSVDGTAETFGQILTALRQSTRDTDIIGWYGNETTIGVIFTEVGSEPESVVKVLSTRMTLALQSALNADRFSHIQLSFLVFPDDCEGQGPGHEGFSALYPDLLHEMEKKKAGLLAKRAFDIVGSVLALVVLSPLWLLIAVAVKLTSRGPLFFRQKRLGQYGKSFTFLKFRSMYVGADQEVHRAYIEKFMSDPVNAGADGTSGTVYKITNDRRVTSVGRLLRRTSLDELPQFLNCLMGQMSLVGPRPPIPYEFKNYQWWHRRRLLAVKPGITGLWQVQGRSRVKFNEMVRMDLEYARSWSFWLDVRILLQTPRAVVTGEGAY